MRGCAGDELIEDVEAALAFRLVHDARLLEEVCTGESANATHTHTHTVK